MHSQPCKQVTCRGHAERVGCKKATPHLRGEYVERRRDKLHFDWAALHRGCLACPHCILHARLFVWGGPRYSSGRGQLVKSGGLHSVAHMLYHPATVASRTRGARQDLAPLFGLHGR